MLGFRVFFLIVKDPNEKINDSATNTTATDKKGLMAFTALVRNHHELNVSF